MVHRLGRAFGRGERGDAVLELALIAPVLLLIVFGILEVGRVIDAWIVVHNAAREGARAGAVADPGPTAGDVAFRAAGDYLGQAVAGRRDLSSTSIAPPTVTVDTIAVTAAANVAISTPLFQSLIGGQVPVRATAVMRRQ